MSTITARVLVAALLVAAAIARDTLSTAYPEPKD